MASHTPIEYLDILRSVQYSDFTIICDHTEFDVHRDVVCLASSRLANQASRSNVFQVAGIQRDIMARAVLFMYGLKDPFYDYTAQSATPPGESIMVGVTPSQKSRVERLPQLSKATPKDAVFTSLTTSVQVYACAEVLELEDLKLLSAKRFVAKARAVLGDDQFAQCLRFMYETTNDTDKDLRLPATMLCLESRSQLSTKTLEVLKQYGHKARTPTLSMRKAPGRRALTDQETVPDGVTLAYIKGVTGAVDEGALREALKIYGGLKHFKLHPKGKGALADFALADGFAAAAAASPITIGSQMVVVEERRPVPKAYGGERGIGYSEYRKNQEKRKQKQADAFLDRLGSELFPPAHPPIHG